MNRIFFPLFGISLQCFIFYNINSKGEVDKTKFNVSTINSYKTDSVCFEIDNFKYCLMISSEDEFFFSVKNNICEDKLQVENFIWNNIPNTRIYNLHGEVKNNIIQVEKNLWVAAIPLGLGDCVLVPVRINNACIEIERNKNNWIICDSPVIFDEIIKVFVKPINRGLDNGKFEVWKMTANSTQLIDKFGFDYELPEEYTKNYIDKILYRIEKGK